jgi:hypothetical protein
LLASRCFPLSFALRSFKNRDHESDGCREHRRRGEPARTFIARVFTHLPVVRRLFVMSITSSHQEWR